jgi:uncharacterized protein (DUF58 family)
VTAGKPEATRAAFGSRLSLWIALGVPLFVLFPGRRALLILLIYNTLLVCLFLWDRARLRGVDLHFARTPLARAPGRERATLRWFAHESLDYNLEIVLRAGPPVRLTVEESAPLGFKLATVQQRSRVALGELNLLSWCIHATRHGSARLSHVFVRRESALGLCALVEAHPCPSELRAYPRLPFAMAPWPTLSPRHPGSVPAQRHGAEQGGEIEYLRAYTPTDPMRSIDWKASAKRNRPITRAYQPERSQTLWIVLDASRGMMALSDACASHGDARVTRFEAALEAGLLLASSALAQGDQVGLLVHGRTRRLSLAPKRGRAHLFTLIEALLNVHPEPSELDAAALLQTFAEQAKKRALFVFFTDLDNGADLEQLAEHANLLTRRHLALCVSLSNQDLARRLTSAIESERDAYRKVAAIHLSEERARLKQSLRRAGLYVIESAPPDLPRATLAEYQRQKRAGRL